VHAQTQADLSLAIDCFERAIRADPDHGRAHGLLALSSIYRAWNYAMSTDVAAFLPLAERAIALDPRDAKAHCALGLGHLLLRDHDRAGYYFEAGLRSNPNDDLLLIEHGRYLMYIDRPEDGLRRIREAMRLDPYHPNWYWNIQGRCLHTLGRHDEALAAFLRHENPPFYVLAYIAACHRQLGQPGKAAEARDRMRQMRPDFDMDRFRSVFPYRNEETKRRFFESLFD
jgi:adenylate cyclase